MSEDSMDVQAVLKSLEITENELECVNTLKQEYPDSREVTLLRFVRARDCDLEKVREMYGNYINWRSNYPENIDLSDAENELKYGVWHFHGLSKTGIPCVIIKAARFIPGGCDKENLTKMVIYAMEEIFKANPKEKVVALVDYAGFGYANVSYDTIRWLISVYSDYYPEVSFISFHFVFIKVKICYLGFTC